MTDWEVVLTLVCKIRRKALNEEDAKLIAKFVPVNDWQWVNHSYEARPMEVKDEACAN
jgi:hypothetical protein